MVRRLALLLVFAAIIVAALPAVGQAGAPAAVRFVPADADPGVGWVSTGVVLTGGQSIEVHAHGQAITGPLRDFPGARSGPDGQAFTCPDPGGPAVGCALDGAPYGALIGKIGSTTFLLGGHFSGVAAEAGELMLAVNDNLGFYEDNRGGFAAVIRTG